MHTLTRITTTLQATQTVAWPHFAGSPLRGAFGHALRRAACITGQEKCTGCPLRNSCAYGVVFDPAPPTQALHPSFRDGLPRYLVQPPALGACQLSRGQSQSFALVLLPGAQVHQPLIQHLLPTVIERQLMPAGQFKLVDTHVEEMSIAQLPQQDSQPQAHGAAANPLPSPNLHSAAPTVLRWHTPLRVQKQGKPIFKPQHLDSATLVRALLRRQLQWCQLTQQTPPDPHAQLQAASACTLDTRNMQWHDIQRHSSSQNQKVPLGGLIGSATLQGPVQALQTLQPLLQLGEQIHIGKEIVMGLGRYRLSTT